MSTSIIHHLPHRKCREWGIKPCSVAKCLSHGGIGCLVTGPSRTPWKHRFGLLFGGNIVITMLYQRVIPFFARPAQQIFLSTAEVHHMLRMAWVSVHGALAAYHQFLMNA